MDRWFTIHKSMSKAVELGSVEHLAWWATKCMPELEPMEVIIAKITAAKCHLGILASHKGRRIDSNNANVVHWVHAHSELEVIMDVVLILRPGAEIWSSSSGLWKFSSDCSKYGPGSVCRRVAERVRYRPVAYRESRSSVSVSMAKTR